MTKKYIYNVLILLGISIIIIFVLRGIYRTGFISSSDAKEYLIFVVIILSAYEVGGEANENYGKRRITLPQAFTSHLATRFFITILFIVGMVLYATMVNVETEQFIIISVGIYFIFYFYNLLSTSLFIRRIKRKNITENE